MKKLGFGFLTAIIITVCFIFNVSAATVDIVNEVVLEKAQTEFTVTFTVNQSSPYAGAEFALQCPEDVTVKSVTYSGANSQAGPTAARGFVWFTYFSGKNDYAGKMTATLILLYSGEENTSVVLDHITIHTVNGEKIDTKEETLRKTILIKRKGATNDVSPLTPPASSAAASSSSGNTSPAETSPDGSSKSGASSTSGTGTASRNDEDTENEAASATSESIQSESIDDPSQNQQNIPDEQNPLAPGQTDTQSADCPWPHMLMLILLIISVLGNLALGYFIINRNRKNKQRN